MRSLFDRISKPLSDDSRYGIDSRSAELRSVEGELNRLLNSRSYFSGQSEVGKTILEYGVVSIVSAGSVKPNRISEVVENVKAAILSFEPRILSPVVHSTGPSTDPTKVMVTVSGTLRDSRTPIRFRIPLELPNGDE